MWIFLPGGLLMPAEVPTMERNKHVADPAFTDNGRFDLQVRARSASHLTNFIRDYMEPLGLPFSEIEATPQMDYNFRFYTTKPDFALAMGKAVLDIDYMKFKPTAERTDAAGKPLYAGGKAYHAVLNDIWGSLLTLGRPGGKWGARSTINPSGYDRASRYGGGSYGGYGRSARAEGVGRSFGNEQLEADWWESEPYFDLLNEGEVVDDYVPDAVDKLEKALEDVRGIPVDQWQDFLTTEQYELVRPLKRDYRQSEKRDRRAARKTRYRRNR